MIHNTRGFNSNSSASAAQAKKEKQLANKIKGLEMANTELELNNRLLSEQLKMMNSMYQELSSQGNIAEFVLKSIEDNFPKLYEHIICLFNNSSYQNARSNQYPEHLKLWYIQYSTFGESIFNELTNDFGFPVFRTVQYYKHSSIIDSGISIDILNGSQESIQQMISICWSQRLTMITDVC